MGGVWLSAKTLDSIPSSHQKKKGNTQATWCIRQLKYFNQPTHTVCACDHRYFSLVIRYVSFLFNLLILGFLNVIDKIFSSIVLSFIYIYYTRFFYMIPGNSSVLNETQASQKTERSCSKSLVLWNPCPQTEVEKILQIKQAESCLAWHKNKVQKLQESCLGTGNFAIDWAVALMMWKPIVVYI